MVIHEPASVSRTVICGDDTVVWRYTTICEGVQIGANCVIGSNVFIGRDCIIGEGVHIQHGAFIPNGTVIEDRVFVGPLVTMTDDRLPRAGKKYRPAPPVLREGCSIGAGAVLLPGVTIGKRAMVAAGALITRDVPEAALAIGRGQAARAEAARETPVR